MLEQRQPPAEKYPTVAPLLNECERLEARHMDLATRLMAEGAPMYTTDFVILGALQRSWDVLDACLSLVRAWNFTAAGTLLRLQLDTLLRIGYLGTVRDPDTVARRIMEGTEFRRLKDADGARLTDARLREILRDRYPWLDALYNEASGMVHLSNKHCFMIVHAVEEGARTARIGVGPGARHWPEAHLRGYLEALAHSTRALLQVIEAWCDSKDRNRARGDQASI